MKKLLILVLVFGLTSVSNAALSGVELSWGGETDGPGNVTEAIWDFPLGTVVIDVVGPAGYAWRGYVIIEWADYAGGYGQWVEDGTYPIVYPAAGDMATITPFSEVGFGVGYEVTVYQGAGTVPGGPAFRLLNV
jgi:hypothetical protein